MDELEYVKNNAAVSPSASEQHFRLMFREDGILELRVLHTDGHDRVELYSPDDFGNEEPIILEPSDEWPPEGLAFTIRMAHLCPAGQTVEGSGFAIAPPRDNPGWPYHLATAEHVLDRWRRWGSHNEIPPKV